MDLKRFIFRSWLYFRIGHGTYFSFILSFAQWIIIFYTLYVASSFLGKIFPDMFAFIIIFAIIYLPICIAAGYIHYKRSYAFGAEVEVSSESNPYSFKALPRSKEIETLEYQILGALLSHRLYEKLHLYQSDGERKKFLEYIQFLQHLQKGLDVREFKKED